MSTRFEKRFHTPKQIKELENLGKRTGIVIEKLPKCPYCGGRMNMISFGKIMPFLSIIGWCIFTDIDDFMIWLGKKGYQRKSGKIGDTSTGGWYNNNWHEYFRKKQDIFNLPEVINIYQDVVDEEKIRTQKFVEYLDFIKENNKKILVFYTDEIATLIGSNTSKFVIPTKWLKVQDMACVCENYPSCDCYCKVYKNREERYELVSTPAKKNLRMLRNEAHYYFGLVIQNNIFKNDEDLYQYLGSIIVTGYGEELHIGACNEYCCTRIIEECIKILYRNIDKIGKISVYHNSSIKNIRIMEMLREISR